MVPYKRDQLAASFQFQQNVDYSLGIEPFVNVVTKRNKRVIWLEINRVDQSGEGDGAAVMAMRLSMRPSRLSTAMP